MTATHFICIALQEDFNVRDYYIIEAKNYRKFPRSAIEQFRKVENGFTVLKSKGSLSRIKNKELRNYFSKCSNLVDKRAAIRLSSNERLSDYLHEWKGINE